MAKFSEQLPRRLRRKDGLNPPPSIAPTTPAQSTDVDLEMRHRTALASHAYDSSDRKKRDAAQRAALHNAIWFQLLSGVPPGLLHPLMDLTIDLEDHDRGLTVARFAPRESQGDFDSSIKWTTRAHLVCMVHARYRIDGKKSYRMACKTVIEDVNKHLPNGVDVGAVIGSRGVTDSELQKGGRQKRDQMTRWIDRLDDYRTKFEHGSAGFGGDDGWAHKSYEALVPMAKSGGDDDTAEADAAMQHIYEYLRDLAVTRIKRAV